MYCRNCGQQLSEDSNFCEGCGIPNKEIKNPEESERVPSKWKNNQILIVSAIVGIGILTMLSLMIITILNSQGSAEEQIVEGNSEKEDIKLEEKEEKEETKEKNEDEETAEQEAVVQEAVSTSEVASQQSDTNNQWIFFPSDTTYITEMNVTGLSQEDVAFMRNEIYARHGYQFQNEPYKSYFASQEWYQPNAGFNETQFSQIEKQNKDFLIEYEKRMGWRN